MDRPWLKFYEPGVRAHIDYPARPMHAFLEDVAARSPEKTATIFGGVVQDALLDCTLSYKELNDQANRMANALAAMGVKHGDRVALYLPNCPQYLISYYATLKLGAIVAPNNPMYVPRELEFQLNDSGAETIVCLSRLYPYVRMVRPNTKLKNVVVTSIKEYFPPRLKAVFEQFVEEKEGHRATIGADEHWFQDVLAGAPTAPPNAARYRASIRAAIRAGLAPGWACIAPCGCCAAARAISRSFCDLRRSRAHTRCGRSSSA